MVKYINKLKFEWDEQKNQYNIIKHNVSFNEAKTIFYDKNYLKLEDINHSINEDRFFAIGKSLYRNVLFVCFCMREGNTIRIISARYAKKVEREVYNAQY